MEPMMAPKIQRMLVWSGPIIVVTIVVGLIPLTGFMPPPSPEDTPEEIAAVFSRDQTRIQIGCVVMMFGMALFAAWGAALTVWMRRMERGFPGLTYGALISIAVSTIILELFPLTWAMAAYRPDELAAETTRAINDWAWFVVLFTWPPFTVWGVLLGLAILNDHNEPGLFPRWSGYLSFWMALLVVPAGTMTFTKSGPMAYDGVVALYIPFVAFFGWICAMTWVMFRAIRTYEHRRVAYVEPASPVSAETSTTVSGRHS